MILLGIMLERIMMNPRRMKTMPRWKVVTMDSDLSGGGLTIASGVSSRVAVLATLCRLVQMIDDPWPAPAPLSRRILLSLRW